MAAIFCSSLQMETLKLGRLSASRLQTWRLGEDNKQFNSTAVSIANRIESVCSFTFFIKSISLIRQSNLLEHLQFYSFEWNKKLFKSKATCKPFLRYHMFSIFLKRQKKKLLYLACDFLGALVYQLTSYGIHTCTSWLFCSLSLLCSLPSVLLYFILQYFQHLIIVLNATVVVAF